MGWIRGLDRGRGRPVGAQDQIDGHPSRGGRSARPWLYAAAALRLNTLGATVGSRQITTVIHAPPLEQKCKLHEGGIEQADPG